MIGADGPVVARGTAANALQELRRSPTRQQGENLPTTPGAARGIDEADEHLVIQGPSASIVPLVYAASRLPSSTPKPTNRLTIATARLRRLFPLIPAEMDSKPQ